jgi:hypothetical protein
MGLSFSAMIRLFESCSKEKLETRILKNIESLFKADSKEDFDKAHSGFCDWGVENIRLSNRVDSPSYGQVAKTLNVVLKVVVYYSHLPSCEKSKELSKWLHAAVDTAMMKMLRVYYPGALKPWPRAVRQVKTKEDYQKIRETVDKFIEEKHKGTIVPVEFDDYYFFKEKREGLKCLT